MTGPRNVDVIRSLGPDEVVDYTQEDVTRRPQRYDVILDVAATRSLADLRHMLASNGRLVLAGAPKSGWTAVFAHLLLALVLSRFDRRVVFYVAAVSHDDLRFLKELVETKKVSPVIDKEYTLSEASEAVRYLGSGQARAKVVINVA